METNKRISPNSTLGKKAKSLLKAAHEYWEVYQKEVGPDAVVWLENDNGCFVLFTRSEYKTSIMAVVSRECMREPVMLDPFLKG